MVWRATQQSKSVRMPLRVDDITATRHAFLIPNVVYHRRRAISSADSRAVTQLSVSSTSRTVPMQAALMSRRAPAVLRQGLIARHARGMSGMAWTNVEMGPPDGILGLVEAFNKDTALKKVNLSVGAYRDNENKPFVLPSVRTAEERVLAAKMNKEYALIVGVDDFVKKARAFALGPDSRLSPRAVSRRSSRSLAPARAA